MEFLVEISLVVLGAFLAFLATWFWKYKSKIDADKKETQNKLNSIDSQLAVLNTQISPFWAAVQTKIAKELTHPSVQFKEMDELLHQLEALTLTSEGLNRLLILLDERINSNDPEVTVSEKNSAKLMKGIMAKVVIEAEDAKKLTI